MANLKIPRSIGYILYTSLFFYFIFLNLTILYLFAYRSQHLPGGFARNLAHLHMDELSQFCQSRFWIILFRAEIQPKMCQKLEISLPL